MILQESLDGGLASIQTEANEYDAKYKTATYEQLTYSSAAHLSEGWGGWLQVKSKYNQKGYLVSVFTPNIISSTIDQTKKEARIRELLSRQLVLRYRNMDNERKLPPQNRPNCKRYLLSLHTKIISKLESDNSDQVMKGVLNGMLTSVCGESQVGDEGLYSEDLLLPQHPKAVRHGILMDLTLGDDEELAWCDFDVSTHAEDEEDEGEDDDDVSEHKKQTIVSAKELGVKDVPYVGFFGLEVPAIRECLEGLNFVDYCTAYEFDKADSIRRQFVDQIKIGIEKKMAIAEANDSLMTIMIKERYYFDRIKSKYRGSIFRPDALQERHSLGDFKSPFVLTDPVNHPASQDIDDDDYAQGIREDKFFDLLSVIPEGCRELVTEDVDRLLAIWEFIAISRHSQLNPPSMDIALGFGDLARCVQPNPMRLPTIAQITFNEIGSLLTSQLFWSVSKKIIKFQAEWELQEYLVYRPINTFTWQYFVGDVLITLAVYQLHPELINLLFSDHSRLRVDLSGERKVMHNIVYLTLCHPSSRVLLDLESTGDVPPNEGCISSISVLLEKLKCYRNVPQLIVEMEAFFVFLTVKSRRKFGDVYKAACKVGKYVQRMLQRLGVSIPFCTHFEDEMEVTGVGENVEERIVDLSLIMGNMMDDPIEDDLLKIEKFLGVLESICPDDWDTALRIDVLERIVDMSIRSDHIREIVNVVDGIPLQAEMQGQASVDSIQDIPDDSELQFAKFTISEEELPTCTLTKMSSKYVEPNATVEWVYLPEDLTMPADDARIQDLTFVTRRFDNTQLAAITNTNQSALKNAVVRTYAARFAAQEIEMKLDLKRDTLLESHVNGTPLVPKTTQRRTECLGKDRYGCQYWIFNAQASFPIVAFADATNNSESSVDGPSMLIKSPDGEWKVYWCGDLPSFLSRLDHDMPCEKHLRNEIVDRYFDIKKRSRDGPLKAVLTRATWLQKMKQVDIWMQGCEKKLSTNPIDPSTSTAEHITAWNMSVEVMLARAVEFRSTLHFAVVTRDEALEQFETGLNFKMDRETVARRKKFRDMLTDEMNEYHWYKGWFRRDALSQARDLSATTIASRLLADPNTYIQYCAQMTKSRFRKQHVVPGSTAIQTAAIANAQKARIIGIPTQNFTQSSHAWDLCGIIPLQPALAQAVEEIGLSAGNKRDRENFEDDDEIDDGSKERNDDGMEVDVNDNKEDFEYEEMDTAQESSDMGVDGEHTEVDVEENEEVSSQRDRQVKIEPFPVERQNRRAESFTVKSFAESLKEKLAGGAKGTKCVEQLDIHTLKVLRRYISGTEAAMAMQVSQSGISLCCNGSKTEAYGFKWRICEDPFPQDADYDERPIEELLRMRVVKGGPQKKPRSDPEYRTPKVYERKQDRQIASTSTAIPQTSITIPSVDFGGMRGSLAQTPYLSKNNYSLVNLACNFLSCY